jgi:hypothetical protein
MPTIRDAAYGWTENLKKLLNSVIAVGPKSGESHYFILVHVKPYDTYQLLQKVLLIPGRCAHLMPALKQSVGLSSMCFEVNTKTDTCKPVWLLPVDFDIPENLLEQDKQVPGIIIQGAKGFC